jgi:hypothetical protein
MPRRADFYPVMNAVPFAHFPSNSRSMKIQFFWNSFGISLPSYACAYLPRNLTRAKWAQFIGDAMPYQAVCENLPIEPEVKGTPTATP